MNQSLSSSAQETAAAGVSDDAYRILLADDSAVIRGLMTRMLGKQDCFKVVGAAANGELAIGMLERQPADVVILDIDMPVMDGLAAIPHLKAVDPGVQIIMASTLTQRNAEISLKALALGAADYIPKPSAKHAAGDAASFNRELIDKVKALAALARRKGVRMPMGTGIPKSAKSPPAEKKKISLRRAVLPKPALIAIGSSTGGPQALFQVVKQMGTALAQPVVIAQHMPPAFTTILAEHITRQCGVTCSEAKDGEIIQPGRYYLAPGDYHMLLVRCPEGVTLKLTKDPPENFCRPAVDPMLRSAAETFGKRVLTVILTGMGQDGLKGCEAVVAAGGGVIAQDESSSIVWGMPGAVAQAGLCSAVLPVGEIGIMVERMAKAGV